MQQAAKLSTIASKIKGIFKVGRRRKPIQVIRNKYPEDPFSIEGREITFAVKDGLIVDKFGNPLHIPQGTNFIIDLDGNLKIGFRHVFLAS